jgi:hypothetical protein
MNCKPVIQYAFILLVITFYTACKVKKGIEKPPVTAGIQTKEAFILNPFGYEPTIKKFSTYLPSYKLQIYTTRNRLNPSITDSIFRFYHKKNELFIYKTKSGRELFVAGNIYDNRILLQNGVKVGIERGDFFRCFSNFKPNANDTIRITSKQAANSFYFIFKRNKLSLIKIDNYID